MKRMPQGLLEIFVEAPMIILIDLRSQSRQVGVMNPQLLDPSVHNHSHQVSDAALPKEHCSASRQSNSLLSHLPATRASLAPDSVEVGATGKVLRYRLNKRAYHHISVNVASASFAAA